MKVSTRIVIEAPADDVWAVIGPGFAHVGDWVAAIDDSEAVGAGGADGAPCSGRTCRVASPGFDHITERLTDYEPASRRLSYGVAHGMPRFVVDARNTWEATAVSAGRTEFSMDAELTLAGIGRAGTPLLRLVLARMGRRTCRDLKTFVETGSPSRAKAIRAHAAGRTRLDRMVLTNAVLTVSCGASLAAFASWWARQLGGADPLMISLVGVGLLGYAGPLAWASGRGVTGEAGRVLAALDAAWVGATAVVLAALGSAFTWTGVGAVVLSSAAVAAVGWAQWRAAAVVDRPAGGPARVATAPEGVPARV